MDMIASVNKNFPPLINSELFFNATHMMSIGYYTHESIYEQNRVKNERNPIRI